MSNDMTDDEIDFCRWWNVISDELKAEALSKRRGGYIHFSEGKGRFWIITDRMLECLNL